MNRYHTVFLALVPLLTAACEEGLVTEDGTACMSVEEDAECPDGSDVSADDLSSNSCGSTVVRVTGDGEYHDDIGWSWYYDTGYTPQPGCCYEVRQTKPDCVYGRPLLVDGEPVLSRVARDPAWAARLAPAEVPDHVRSALAARWTRAALDEHASVAAFGKVALDLMRLGAPAELIADAHQAALDEIRHARLGFALASALAGEDVGPGPYPVDSIELAQDLVTLAVDAARESCLGETVAAMLAREGAARTDDPVLAGVLNAIAADEERHAQLGWKIVAWALRAGGPEVHGAVAEVFANAASQGVAVPLAQDEDLARWGLLGQADAAAVADRCVREIVLPAARVLFALAKRDTPVVVYEAGEALRLHEPSVQQGIDGIHRVMAHVGIGSAVAPAPSRHLETTRWVRAPRSGIFRATVDAGAAVEKGQPLGEVADPTGGERRPLRAPLAGHVITLNHLPVVNQGDALVRIGA